MTIIISSLHLISSLSFFKHPYVVTKKLYDYFLRLSLNQEIVIYPKSHSTIRTMKTPKQDDEAYYFGKCICVTIEQLVSKNLFE